MGNDFEEQYNKYDFGEDDQNLSVDDLDSSNDNTEEQEDNNFKGPSVDDLDETPFSQRYKVIQYDDEWPEEGRVLTISKDVKPKLQPPRTSDGEGNKIPPIKSENGSNPYYKEKLILFFDDLYNGQKIKAGVPSIFYSVSPSGEVARIPSIPRTCPDSKLNDKFTPSLSKVRNLFCKKEGKNPLDVSNKDFVLGLMGKKVLVTKERGENKGTRYAALRIEKFVD